MHTITGISRWSCLQVCITERQWVISHAIIKCYFSLSRNREMFQQLMETSNDNLPQGHVISEAVSMIVLLKSESMTWFTELHGHQFDAVVEDNCLDTLLR